jgi:L-asparaginase
MLIINTGCTFNKVYNKLSGNLDIPINNNDAILHILSNSSCGNNFFSNYNLTSIISKDSLEFTQSDRQLLLDTILNSNETDIIIVHGTDTMYKSALFLSKDKNILDKKIIFVGSMKPFCIDNIEATFNFAMALGYIKNMDNNIAVSMNGHIGSFKNVLKNKIEGFFEFNLLD